MGVRWKTKRELRVVWFFLFTKGGGLGRDFGPKWWTGSGFSFGLGWFWIKIKQRVRFG